MSSVNKLHSKIWAMDDKITTLDSVRSLLTLNYYEPIEYLSAYSSMAPNERTLLHHWASVSPNKKYELIRNGRIEDIKYFTATGILEQPVAKTRAFVDDTYTQLLSRERRITSYNSNAIFVDFNGKIYSIVYGTRSAFSARTILMGNGNKTRRKPEWGKIDDKPASFNLNNDYFYWKFNKYDNDIIIQTDLGNIEIRDINGIGHSSERKQCSTKGNGPNYLNDISSKSSLGCNYSIYESDFELVSLKASIITCINEYADCMIDKSRTVFLLPNDQVEFITGKEELLLLHIYLEIIPGLISIYNRDKRQGNWTITESAAAQRRWALDAINELCWFHQLTLDELKKLPYFRNSQ